MIPSIHVDVLHCLFILVLNMSYVTCQCNLLSSEICGLLHGYVEFQLIEELNNEGLRAEADNGTSVASLKVHFV